MVVGVEDDEFGQRVAAAISMEDSHSHVQLSMDQFRDALRSKLPGYKLPTLLRIVQGEIPKGPTGKVQKKILGPAWFPSPGLDKLAEVQIWKKSAKPTIQARL